MLSEEERWKERKPSTAFEKLTSQQKFCHYPFDTLALWSDGQVGPCCAYHGKNVIVGNIHESTLPEIWNGERMKRLREQHISGNLNIICQDCLSMCDYTIIEEDVSMQAN